MHKDHPVKKVLVVYYSFSGQTGAVIRRFTEGLSGQGIQVTTERLYPAANLRFPLSGIGATLIMMLTTLLRCRIPIKKLSATCHRDYDLLVIAGPTWSYNPSGPVLSFLDREGARLLRGRRVLAIISCRGYWRLHWFSLRRAIKRSGATVLGYAVFSHPVKEPWRTIGVFLKIAGRSPERSSLLGRFYQRYGHSRDQLEVAFDLGSRLGAQLNNRAAALPDRICLVN